MSITDELRAENSKLRKRVAELDELLPENGRWYRAETVEAYVTEIAKLRELVRELLSGYACGRGRLCDECSWDGLGDPCTFACPVRVRARELGVEVGE